MFNLPNNGFFVICKRMGYVGYLNNDIIFKYIEERKVNHFLCQPGEIECIALRDVITSGSFLADLDNSEILTDAEALEYIKTAMSVRSQNKYFICKKYAKDLGLLDPIGSKRIVLKDYIDSLDNIKVDKEVNK